VREPGGPIGSCLGREGAEGSVFGIDLEREAAIPEDGEVAGLVDFVDDASVACTQSRIAAGVADELDPRAHSDPSPDSSEEMPCALWVHKPSIGFDSSGLIPQSFRFLKPFGQGGETRGPAKSREPADRPNSTA
jgi:hypothetical protein